MQEVKRNIVQLTYVFNFLKTRRAKHSKFSQLTYLSAHRNQLTYVWKLMSCRGMELYLSLPILVFVLIMAH